MNRPRQPMPVQRPPVRGRVLALTAAFALGAMVSGGVVFGMTRPSSIEQMADQIRAESALRDKAQIKTLTELARTTRDRLVPCSTDWTGPCPWTARQDLP